MIKDQQQKGGGIMSIPNAFESSTTESIINPEPFFIKDCALVALATGKRARMLQEFRSELASIEASSIYHHYWGGLLQARFDEREYNNAIMILPPGSGMVSMMLFWLNGLRLLIPILVA